MIRTRYQVLLSILSGIMVCCSFPTNIKGIHFPEMGWLMWVALVPLFITVRVASPRRAFLLTFIAALVWYGGSVFWVYRAMHTFGHLPAVTSFLVLVLLVLIIAIYIALAPLIARFIQVRFKGEFIVWLSASWVAVEILRNFGPCNGFPWSNVAMSQWRILPIIQIVDVVGIYGLIFLIVWVNAFLAEFVVRLRGEDVQLIARKAIVTFILISTALSYGFWRLHTFPSVLSKYSSISVGMVQGNIDQEEKWSKDHAAKNLNIHREGTRRLLEGTSDLILWPEASFPWPVKTNDTDIDPQALGLPEESIGDMPYVLIGAVSETPEENYYNSAILFDAHGKIVGRYHKAHLVPFGEYVPYKKILFFAKKLTQPAGNFLAGETFAPLVAGHAKLGMLICYEDVFPEIARSLVKQGAEVLTNITNDAWYGVSSAPFQHLALSVFRAIENRRFLLRATNSGVSAVVMPTGKIVVESNIFEQSLIVSPVTLLNEFSLYTRLGDWFAWGCLVYVALGVAMAIWKKRRI